MIEIPSPPVKLQDFIGGHEFFDEIGDRFFGHFIKFGNLKPEHKVLDVGCGVGRMAIPLVSHLAGGGTYDGFDIHKKAIDWCQENITRKFPNFNFIHADIYNDVYNKNGKYKASEYKFPYPDSSFDFIFLSSVFTHLLPKDMEKYLSEISRVLKFGGRCLITYIVLNDESLRNMKNGVAQRNLKYKFDGYRVIDKDNQEILIGFYEEDIRKLYQKYNLRIIEPIRYGKWSGIKDGLDFQDIIFSEKIKINR